MFYESCESSSNDYEFWMKNGDELLLEEESLCKEELESVRYYFKKALGEISKMDCKTKEKLKESMSIIGDYLDIDVKMEIESISDERMESIIADIFHNGAVSGVYVVTEPIGDIEYYQIIYPSRKEKLDLLGVTLDMIKKFCVSDFFRERYKNKLYWLYKDR